jgi:hypothetical protein
MNELPSTKAKQREHVMRLMSCADTLATWCKATQLQVPAEMKLLLQGLHDLHEQMFNRRGPRGMVTADPVTPTKIRNVFRLRDEHPSWSQKQIAQQLNIDVGRVSEILHGKRE